MIFDDHLQIGIRSRFSAAAVGTPPGVPDGSQSAKPRPTDPGLENQKSSKFVKKYHK
ncbi:hypothetical protein [Sphingopyxis lindanitolerans]|uniref:hypothetical protein n=1 Tax=Sphingopyxis lindanitolerans TaxID=2054227 RepID=UPI0013048D15|nr:hypothetical protein [Sphingopyxis lindanitolerans]